MVSVVGANMWGTHSWTNCVCVSDPLNTSISMNSFQRSDNKELFEIISKNSRDFNSSWVAREGIVRSIHWRVERGY